VIELRQHRALYPALAVDDAVRTFAPHARLERADDTSHHVVRISDALADDAAEREIAGALGNWALGLSIKGSPRP